MLLFRIEARKMASLLYAVVWGPELCSTYIVTSAATHVHYAGFQSCLISCRVECDGLMIFEAISPKSRVLCCFMIEGSIRERYSLSLRDAFAHNA